MNKGTKQALIFLGSTHFLIHVYSQLLQASLPIIRQLDNLSLTEASLLVSAPLLLQVLLYLPAGIMADKRANIVLTGSFIVTVLGALFVPNSRSYLHLLISFSLISIGSTLYHPPALKATSELEDENKGFAMGIQNAGGSLGYSAGPLLYSLLLPLYGWRIGYYLWAPLLLVAALYSYRYISHIRSTETDKIKGSIHDIATKQFAVVVLGGVLTDATFICISTYITTYYTESRGITPGFAGLIFGVGPLLGILGSILGGGLGDRIGRRGGFLLVVFGMGVALALIPLTGSVLVSGLFYVVWRGFYSACMPLVNSLIADNTVVENRSLGYSVYSILSNLVGSAITPLVSMVIEISSLEILFPISIGLLLLVALVMVFIKME
jgi:FSR family fosmidomycin resistance protein-like MFS transporter